MAVCPECANKQEGEPGDSLLCPACMTSFVVPVVFRTPTHFDLALPDGTKRENLTRIEIRESIYCHRVPVGSRIRAPELADGAWQPVYTWPDFLAIFQLLGIEPPMASGTRRLSGWKGVEVKSEPAAKKAERPRIAIDKHQVKKAQVMLRGLPVAVVAAIVVACLFAAFVGSVLVFAWL